MSGGLPHFYTFIVIHTEPIGIGDNEYMDDPASSLTSPIYAAPHVLSVDLNLLRHLALRQSGTGRKEPVMRVYMSPVEHIEVYKSFDGD